MDHGERLCFLVHRELVSRMCKICTWLCMMATLQSILNYFEPLILINGTGKTTTATLVARESGRDVLELNASDARSKKALGEALGDVTGSQVLSFENMGKGKKESNVVVRRKRCIIMDEVDGMGAGDRSGMSELIQMIKKSKVPIVSKCVHAVNCVLISIHVHQSYPLLSCFPYLLCNIDGTDMHLQRPFLSQNEIPRPILHGPQVFPSNENGHCKACRRNRPS